MNGDDQIDSLAEVFSLIVAIDQIERAYIRDSVNQTDYTNACTRLLAQYQTLMKNPQIEALSHDIDAFSVKYRMGQESAGISRIKVGIPATSEASTPYQPQNVAGSSQSSSTEMLGSVKASNGGKSAKAVFEVTGLFITVMDGLKLGLRAKDDLHPLFSNLLTSLNSATEGKDFAGRGKLVQWLIHLNKMKIDDELTDEEVRQCLFDVNSAYESYSNTLD